jgi:hypothetical protein
MKLIETFCNIAWQTHQKREAVILLSTDCHEAKVASEEKEYKDYIILHNNATRGPVEMVIRMAKEYVVRQHA